LCAKKKRIKLMLALLRPSPRLEVDFDLLHYTYLLSAGWKLTDCLLFYIFFMRKL
jgi:hypothetical protein